MSVNVAASHEAVACSENYFFFLIREYSLLLWEISYLILVVIQGGSRLLQILISCGI